MSMVNLVTLCAFFGALICGGMFFILQDLRNKRPEGRIHTRMLEIFGDLSVPERDGDHDAAMFTLQKQSGRMGRWLTPKLLRLDTVAGKKGVRTVGVAVVSAIAIAFAMTQWMPLPQWSKPVLLVGVPLIAMTWTYRFLIERFRRRFLDGFPDIIDTIIRAVRAGVPVTQVFATAGQDASDPLKHEFDLMSDSLELGRELDDVLATATKRIDIADFSFFCVCLLLQRETGGQLGETLENLSGIVRSRKEIRQKAKALTAEARITTKILAAIPVIILLSMYALNRDYLMILFNREAGHKLLTFAAISVVLGTILIGRMSKLDTSR
ncbi:type II secretion system F family protein [Robbsia sp. Bb-Pol-6]|uniref:Type II secretion system F family protein n=1 Tax=Robbsia betulipollinis TaxID=2981849 RepID=A0ABT3ZSG5_9BURK|nr:type II secretion system F family protein [Robbsia betulipollinis]MCY0389484.1 type II secretion system F family protein [Robbsia betulipollinis]